MRRRWMHLIAGLAMVVLCISTCTTTTNAAVIWEDDFDDGTYAPEWTICDNLTSEGFYNGAFGWNGSTWSATNNYLEKVGHDEWGVISQPSNKAYGRWSFDFKTNGSTIFFISNNYYDFDDFEADLNSYYITFDVDTYYDTFSITLAKGLNDTRTILGTHYQVPVADWHHLDVTRNTTGYFSVYLDRSQNPIIEEEDTDIDTSEMFWLWYYQGEMIDNIVVDDDWNYTITTTTTTTTATSTSPTTTPTTPPPLPWDLIAIGGGVAVLVIVLVVVFSRRR
jgi:hypothetical protein